MQALKRLKGKIGTIYTDSKYGFGVVHTFGKIWEERGLVNSQGKDLIHQELIKQILVALRGPEKIAVVHLRGHQKGVDYKTRGNNIADQETRKAALLVVRERMPKDPLKERKKCSTCGSDLTRPPCYRCWKTWGFDAVKCACPEYLTDPPRENPCYIHGVYSFTIQEKDKLHNMGIKEKEGIWKLPDGREVLPKPVAIEILRKLHERTHWGVQALVDQFARNYMTISIYSLAKSIVHSCVTCQRVNKNQVRERPLGGRELAHRPFAKVQIDFTELPKVGRYKYLLVIVDHLTHFVEAYPTARSTAQTVAKILLEELIPRYGIIETIDSDRGPHFTSKIINDISEILGIKWEYHTPWHPQSSGRVERMNGEIKQQLTKLMIETKLSWVKCLPLALLNIRTRPRTDVGLSPFEMLYGMPYNLETPQDHPQLKDSQVMSYITELMSHRETLKKKGMVVQRPPLDIAIHKVQPGDYVLVKSWRESTLTPHWEGPYLVLLTTETAVRTAEKGWTHASRIKGPVPRSLNKSWQITSPPGDLRVKLKKTVSANEHLQS